MRLADQDPPVGRGLDLVAAGAAGRHRHGLERGQVDHGQLGPLAGLRLLVVADEEQAGQRGAGQPEGDRVDVGVELEHELRMVVRRDRVGAGESWTNSTTSLVLWGQVAAQSVPSGAKARLPTRMSLKWVKLCGGRDRRPRCRCPRRRRSARCPAGWPGSGSGRRRTGRGWRRVWDRAARAGRRRSWPRAARRRRAPCRRSATARWPAAFVAWPPSAVKAKSWFRAGPPLTSTEPSGEDDDGQRARCSRRSGRCRWRRLGR